MARRAQVRQNPTRVPDGVDDRFTQVRNPGRQAKIVVVDRDGWADAGPGAAERDEVECVELSSARKARRSGQSPRSRDREHHPSRTGLAKPVRQQSRAG